MPDPSLHRRPRARKRTWWAGSAAVVAAAIGWAVVVAPSGGTPLTVADGVSVARFELPNLVEGGPAVSVADAGRGAKPVIVNFWASWCRPCLAEMPDFEAAARELGGRVAFIGVNHLDKRGPALDLLRRSGVTYPSGFDPSGQVAVGLTLRGMPTTLFVSAEGIVVERRTGPLTRDQLVELARDLAGE